MTEDNATIRLRQLSDDVIAVDLHLWCDDDTVDWYPSLHKAR